MSETPAPDAESAALMTPAAPGPTSRGRRPSRRTLIIAGAAVLAIAAAVAIPVTITVQESNAANDRYDTALAERAVVADELSDALSDIDSLFTVGGDSVRIADDTIAAALDGFVGAEQKAALTDARDALVAANDAASGVDAVVPDVAERPTGTSELDVAAAELTSETSKLQSTLAELAPVSAELDRATLAVSDAGDALISTLQATADAVLAANYSAENLVHIDYSAEVGDLNYALSWDDKLAPRIASYVSAAQRLQASHASEEAQKAGPLYAQRAAVEAFARSIAGGVLLDFDWAPIVNGYGEGYGYGGTSTWNTRFPGYSTMSLSNSVAELWGVNSAVASLVAHEVGHSITSKCYDLFSTSFGSQDEVWATAWAIGMGYAEDGSGESIYGRPSDEQIALSSQCR